MKISLLIYPAATALIVTIIAFLWVVPKKHQLWLVAEPGKALNDLRSGGQVFFLQDAPMIDEERPVLVLHEPATGDGIRAIDDTALLGSLQEDAFYTLGPERPRRFLDKTPSSSSYFITLYRDGHPAIFYTCEGSRCPRAPTPGFAPENSHLQALLDASYPVERYHGAYPSRSRQLEVIAAAQDDPDVIAGSIDAFDPYQGESDFGGTFSLSLPTLYLPTDLTEEERVRIADQEVRSMMEQISGILDSTGLDWRLDSETQINRRIGPLLRLRSDGGEYSKPLIGRDGERIPMEGFEIFAANFVVRGPREMFDKISEGAAARISSPFGLTQEVRGALDQEVMAATGEDCECCWSIDPQYEIMEGVRADAFTPPSYPVQYFRIQRSEE